MQIFQETINLLHRIHKHSMHHKTRMRAHILILHHSGHSISSIITIYKVTRRSIYNLYNAYKKNGLLALYHKKGAGRPAKLDDNQKDKIKEWIKQYPKSLKAIVKLIEENFKIKVSTKTIKRILKAFKYSWHRCKHKPAGEPPPEEYERKKEELEELNKQHQKGKINLYYGDASGFSLTSNIPYAWQEIGGNIEIPTAKSKLISVFGFLSADGGELTAYKTTDTINSELLISFVDDFCKTINFTSVLVIDNAPIHKSKLFLDRLEYWSSKNLEIYFLPTYSPNLNLIEKLWWFMKLEWIDFKAYLSLPDMEKYIDDIVKNYGLKYEINFK